MFINKLTALTAAAVLSLSLFGCSNNGTTSDTRTSDSPKVSPESKQTYSGLTKDRASVLRNPKFEKDNDNFPNAVLIHQTTMDRFSSDEIEICGQMTMLGYAIHPGQGLNLTSYGKVNKDMLSENASIDYPNPRNDTIVKVVVTEKIEESTNLVSTWEPADDSGKIRLPESYVPLEADITLCGYRQP